MRDLSKMNSLEQRFWEKVDKKGDSECWNWTASKGKNGYGNFTVGAHRLAYYLMKGPVPDGLMLDHLCRNHSCVNPSHLEPVTNKINVLRGESPWAKEARKTHCNNGHPLTGGNLIPAQLKRGHRDCRICANSRARVNYRKANQLTALTGAAKSLVGTELLYGGGLKSPIPCEGERC